MSRHTPSPWEAEDRCERFAIHAKSARTGEYFEVATVYDDNDAADANAALIAAAPSFAKAWLMVPEEIRKRVLCAMDDADAQAIDAVTLEDDE